MAVKKGGRGFGHMVRTRGVSGPLAISGTALNAWQNAAYSWTPTVTGGSGTRTYALALGTLPTGLTLNTSTGAITGTPTAIGTSSGISISVTDSTGTQTLSGLSIQVVAQLTISGTPSPTGTQGSAYSFTPSSTGGLGTKTFALTGTLPNGLSFNTTTGAITGTPTIKATATGLNISVSDSIGTVSLGTFSITVASNLAISGTPGAATNGTAYSFTPTTTGGTPAYSYALTGTLPTGLSFDTTTGAITGTPTVNGTTSGLNITVTDSIGTAVSLGTFSITVNSSATPAVRNAVVLALPGHNAAVPQTSTGTTSNWTVNLVNESGAAMTDASLVLLGWYLTTTGTANVGNDVTTTAAITYGGNTDNMLQSGSTTITITDGATITTDKVTLTAPIPAGATFTVSGSSTVPNTLKYNRCNTISTGTGGATFVNIGLAGVRTHVANSSTLKKLSLLSMGDSINTNNGSPMYLASIGLCPCAIFSIVGTTANSYATGTNFDKIAALAGTLGATHVTSNWGTNDLGSRTAAQLITDLQTLQTKAAAQGVKWAQMTLTPNPSSAGTVTATSVTSSGNTLTVVVPDATKFNVGQAYTLSGAAQSEYNTSFVVATRDTGTNTLTAVFIGSATPTATGTITVKGYQQNWSARELQVVSATKGPKITSFNASVRGGLFDSFIEWGDAIEVVRDDGLWPRGGNKSRLLGETAGSVTAGFTPTTTQFKISNTLSGVNCMNAGKVLWTSGTNIGVISSVSSGPNASNVIQLTSALAAAPAIGDTYVLLPFSIAASSDGLHPLSAVPSLVGSVAVGGAMLLYDASVSWITANA